MAEQLERRAEKSEARKLKDEIFRCYLEDVRRPHEPGGSNNSGRTRKPVVARADIRPEQIPMGFAMPDKATTEQLERLEVPIKGLIPAFMRTRLKSEAGRGHHSESLLIRWLIAQHLDSVESVLSLHGYRKTSFKFLLCRHRAAIWQAKKAQLQCSSSELLAALIIKEWK